MYEIGYGASLKHDGAFNFFHDLRQSLFIRFGEAIQQRTVHVQHADDLVSIYRYCPEAMKKKGERITAGTAIALTGGQAFEFELWYRGDPVDPALYINF